MSIKALFLIFKQCHTVSESDLKNTWKMQTLSDCDDEHPCQGLGEHAHFKNFGIAFLTLFRVATGDNWNGIMKASSCHFVLSL